MPKKIPRPRPLSGAGRGKGPGAHIFRGPVHRVTNSMATVTPQTVWTAKKSTIGRPPHHFPEPPGASTPLELNKALLNPLFRGAPLAPTASILLLLKDCPEVVASEVETAVAQPSPLSAQGPLTIPNPVWKNVNMTAPHLLLKLLSALVFYGFYPLSLKKAAGIVLDKLGNLPYNSASFLHIIVLLLTFSKILGRIMNNRLSCVARMIGLLNPHQCRSLV